MKARIIALLLAFVAPVNAMQQQGASTGRIEGMVLKAGTNDPVSGATVWFIRVNPPAGAAPLPTSEVTTDRDGKFVSPGLDAGAYRLLVTNAGYVRQEYGQRSFPGQGTVLTLSAGEVIKDLTARLTQAGNVGGRLWDNYGKPAVGVPVQLLKSSYNATGQRTFQTAGVTRTNDRGEYRLYWVTPGRYFLVAGSNGPSSGAPAFGPAVSPNDPYEGYAFTYYPGVTDISSATTLEVKSGSDLAMDLPVAKQQLYRIRGKVVDAVTGQSPQSINLTLAYSPSPAGSITTVSFSVSYNPAAGTFEVPRPMPPGVYMLQASGQAMARVALNVVDHVEGLVVVVNNGFNIEGRVVIEGQSDGFAIERLRIQLKPVITMGVSGLTAPKPNADGTFRFEHLNGGDYRVSVNPEAGLPEAYYDFYIKEARLDRNDVLNQPLSLSNSTQTSTTLEIVLSTKVGHVEGTVLDEKLQPVAGVQAVLVPDRNLDRFDLYKAVTTDSSGRFTIRAVPPGEYKLIAWATLESYSYFDPDVLKSAEPMAKSVHVTEGSRHSVDVRVIP